jgi:hypothetical protein
MNRQTAVKDRADRLDQERRLVPLATHADSGQQGPA